MPKISLHETIERDMRLRIEAGEWREGSLIPGEVELAEAYGVSRPTVRQALQTLVSEGLLERRRRRGTIVRSPKIDQSFALALRSFDDEMIANERVPRTQVLLLKRSPADDEVAQALSLEPGDAVFKLVRLRYADETPNVLNESYISAWAAPELDECDFSQRSLYAVLSECGHAVVSARRRLEVIKADETSATLLDVDEGDPLFLFHTVGFDGEGRAVEYSIASYRGASNSFEFSVGLG